MVDPDNRISDSPMGECPSELIEPIGESGAIDVFGMFESLDDILRDSGISLTSC